MAQARIQAHVHAFVRRTAIYGRGVGESHAPDLGRDILPNAAGCGTRPLVGRAWNHRHALRISCKNASTRTRIRKAFSNICARRWGIAHAQTLGVRARHLLPAGELAPLSAGHGATDLHGGAQAIKASMQAHVNGCVRRTATYACGVRKAYMPHFGRERSPLAAGWGTRVLVGRSVVRPTCTAGLRQDYRHT